MSIVSSFDHAAQSYDATADIQHIVAETMLARMGALSPRTILDIGCGTGLLTGLLRQRWPQASITAVDMAPAMLAVARTKLPDVRFVEANAASLPFIERFDLVISSMVLHWLDVAALGHWQRFVAPGGVLHVALPVEGSLGEWQALCAQHGVTGRVWKFPPRALFEAKICRHSIIYRNAREFLHAMKHTGAAIPDPATPVMASSVLRRLLRAAPQPFRASFDIAYL